MSSSRLYKRYLKLLDQWPLDPSKGRQRDLGQHLRNRITSAFKDGENTEIPDVAKCEAIVSSLERIANDTYFLPNDAKIATATGMDPGSISLILSEEGMQMLEEAKQSKILLPFTRKSKKSSSSDQ